MVADVPSGDDRTRLLSRLAATLASLTDAQPQPWRLCEAVRRILGAEGVALTMEYSSDSRTTVCATDDVAEGVENLQEILGQGPGYEAASSNTVVAGDLAPVADQRWPMLAQAVDERFGPIRLFAVPITIADHFSGVITLYTRHGTPLRESVPNAQYLANTVGAALLTDFHEQDGMPDDPLDLTGPWNTRAVVHQATGMVMAQLHCPPGDALVLMRAHAYALDADIYRVAALIVDKTVDFADLGVEGDRYGSDGH